MKTTSLLLVLSIFLLMSCDTFKSYVKDSAIECVVDPQTDTQIFTRNYDTEPYRVNVGGVVKARKQKKRQKLKEVLDNYDRPTSH